QMWADAQRAEIARVQSMGQTRWDGYTSSAGLTAAHRKTFAEAVSLYPDSMVHDAKWATPSLNVRYTKKRAHFARLRTTAYQTHEHVLMGVWGIDSKTPTELAVIEGSSPKDAAQSDVSRRHFFHPTTDEARAYLEEIAEAHNRGRSETYLPGRVGRGGDRRPRRVGVDEVWRPGTGGRARG